MVAKKICLSLYLFIVFCAAPLSLAGAAETLEVGVVKKFPPQYQLDINGDPTGYAIDSFDAIASRANIKPHYVLYESWSELQQALKSADIDIIPNMGIVPSREKWCSFSRPTETFFISLFVRNGTTDIDSLDDFIDRPLGVVEANVGVKIAERHGGLNVKTFPHLEEAFYALLSGNIDGIVYPQPVFLKFAQSFRLEERIKIVGSPLLEVKRGIAVAKGNNSLIDQLNPHLQTFLHSPEYQDIYTKWYGKPTPFWTIKRLSVVFCTVIIFIATILAIWRYLSLQKLAENLRRELEEQHRELTESEENLRVAQQIAHMGSWKLDLPSNKLWWSQEIYNIFEIDPAKFSATMETFVACIHPDDRNAVQEAYSNSVENRTPIEMEHRLLLPDGRIKYVHEYCRTFYDSEGKAVRSIGTLQDITQAKQAEAKQIELETQLRQKIKMEAIGYMAGGMAHNFNNNLTIILGNIELSQMKLPKGSAISPLLENAVIAVNRSRDLIQKIITYSRKGLQVKTLVQLPELINKTIMLLQTTLPKTIELQQQISPESDRTAVNADPSQIQEALINLCNNAVRAMNEEGILRIRLDTVELNEKEIPVQYEATPGTYAKLSVQDTGCGMTVEMVDKIFDPFFTTKKEYEGAGMGLATVQGVIAQHGGLIRVNSIPEQGTVVSLYFPIVNQALPESKPVEGALPDKRFDD